MKCWSNGKASITISYQCSSLLLFEIINNSQIFKGEGWIKRNIGKKYKLNWGKTSKNWKRKRDKISTLIVCCKSLLLPILSLYLPLKFYKHYHQHCIVKGSKLLTYKSGNFRSAYEFNILDFWGWIACLRESLRQVKQWRR